MKYYFEGSRTGKKGATRKYIGKVDLSKSEFDYVKELKDGYSLHSKVVYCIRLKRKIRLAFSISYIRKTNFSTDWNLSAEKNYQYYQAWFQIEFLFIDVKHYLGLEDCMSLNEKALDFHFKICMTALNFAKLEDKMNRTERTPFSIINYKLRLYN